MPSDLARYMAVMALAAYAGGLLSAVLALRMPARKLAAPVLLILAGGLVFNAAAMGVQIAEGQWLLGGTFEAFCVLAMLVALMLGYLKSIDRHRMPELVLLPVAAACMGGALAMSGGAYRAFAPHVWLVAHVVFSVLGTLCLAVAAGSGVLYLRTDRRLRRKDAAALTGRWPSLEKLDAIMRGAIPVGFALLTLTMVVGAYGGFLAERTHWVRTWWKHPKMLIAAGAWLVYAVAVHAAFGRRFRGRRAAVLSLAGLVLVVVVLLVSLLLPAA